MCLSGQVLLHCFRLLTLLFFSGDIGGSLGLFIGASAMTLFEVIDFIANKVAEWCLYRRNKKQDKDIQDSSRL